MRNTLALGLAAMVAVFGISVTSNEASVSGADGQRLVVPATKTHWLTVASGVRHNSGCRYFKNSKGRMCEPDEGRACKKCGG